MAKSTYRFSVGLKVLTENVDAVVEIEQNEELSEELQDLELMKAYDEWLGEVLQYSIEKNQVLN